MQMPAKDIEIDNHKTSSLDPQDQWLSIGDAAELLSISRDTLRRWEKVGKVQVYRSPTNRRQYKQSDLEELYQAKSTKTPFVTKPSFSTLATPPSSPTILPTSSADIPSIQSPLSPLKDTLDKTESQPQTPTLSVFPTPPTEPPPPPTTTPDLQTLPSESKPIPSSTLSPSVLDTTLTPPPDYRPPVISTSPVKTTLSPSPSSAASFPLPFVPTATPSNSDISPIDLEESPTQPTQILKIIAIVLSALLIFLGITITLLVFL